MNKLSTIAATALLCVAPAAAEEAISGDIYISRATTTVNRTTKPVKLKKVSAKTNIITAKKIKERGYRTVTEVFNHEAGIAVSSNGGAGQPASIFVRGMASSDVLVMVDGEPMVDYTQPSPAPLGLENINIDDIEKIEVIKGAQSGVWGANAVAGVINIITHKARKDYASVYLGYGSHGTREGGFTISDKGTHGSFYLSHKLYRTDGISALAPMSAEADGYNYEDTHFKAELKDDDGGVYSAFWHHHGDKFEYDSAGDPDDTKGKGDSDTTDMGISYKYDNGGKLTLDAKASILETKRHQVDAYGPYDTTGYRQALSAVATYRFTDKNKLSVGFERSLNSFGAKNSYGNPSEHFSNDAVFANYTYTIDDLLGAETTFNAALRYDYFDKFADKGTYRLGIKRNCNAIEGLHTAANIYSAYKAPSLYQLVGAKGTLKPEYTTGYDISAGYKNIFNITYFKNKTTDKIVNPTGGFPAKYTNDPATKSVSGIELSGGLNLWDTGFYVGANFTHLFQDHLVRRAQNSGNLFVDYHFNSDTNLNLSLHYEGARDDMDYSSYPAKPVRLSSYKTLNASVITKVADHLDLSVGVKNILGEKYQTAKGYNTEGRSVYARVKYTF